MTRTRQQTGTQPDPEAAASTKTPSLWGNVTLEPGMTHDIVYPTGAIALTREASFIRAVRRDENGEVVHRYEIAAYTSWQGVVRIRPSLPERPIVAVADVDAPDMVVPAGCEVSVWVQIPVSIDIFLPNKGEREESGRAGPAISVSPITLHSTWYGGPVTGRLCYRVNGFSIDPVTPTCADLFACARVVIANQDRRASTWQRIVVLAPRLGLYRVDGGLYTDPMRLELKQDNEVNVIPRKVKPTGGIVIRQPRMATSEHLAEQSRILLRELTNLG